MLKRFVFLFVIFTFVNIVRADTETLQWYVDGDVYATTTCESGGNITLPNTPTKIGYAFQGWRIYTPVEYLESTGIQYIDTGIIADVDKSIEIQFSDPVSWVVGAGVTLGGRSDDFGISHSAIRFGTSYTNTNINFSTGVHTVKFGKNGYIVDGASQQSWNTAPVIGNTGLIWLFKVRGSSATNASKIYYSKIYNNDTLVRDFIPVLDENGVPCMYDKVSDTFFYNAGSGQFDYGNPI